MVFDNIWLKRMKEKYGVGIHIYTDTDYKEKMFMCNNNDCYTYDGLEVTSFQRMHSGVIYIAPGDSTFIIIYNPININLHLNIDKLTLSKKNDIEETLRKIKEGLKNGYFVC